MQKHYMCIYTRQLQPQSPSTSSRSPRAGVFLNVPPPWMGDGSKRSYCVLSCCGTRSNLLQVTCSSRLPHRIVQIVGCDRPNGAIPLDVLILTYPFCSSNVGGNGPFQFFVYGHRFVGPRGLVVLICPASSSSTSTTSSCEHPWCKVKASEGVMSEFRMTQSISERFLYEF